MVSELSIKKDGLHFIARPSFLYRIIPTARVPRLPSVNFF